MLSLDENDLPSDSTLCLLCNGILAYKGEDRDRFYNHMKFQHGAFFNLEFIKAGCLMDEDEKTAVIGIMEKKENSLEDETFIEEMAVMEEAGDEKLLTEEDYMNVVEESETKKNSSTNVEESVKVHVNSVTDQSTMAKNECLEKEEVLKQDERSKDQTPSEVKRDKEMKKHEGKRLDILVNPDNALLQNVKLREVKVDIPFLNISDYKHHIPSEEEGDASVKDDLTKVVSDDNSTCEVKNFILDNASPKKKQGRRKVFTCDICSKKFPANFHNLVKHKMKIHKISKKNAKVISMQYVKYEEIPTILLKKSEEIEQVEMVTIKKEQIKTVESTNAHISKQTVDLLSETSYESALTCMLCKIKTATEEKLKSHMTNRHAVVESKLAVFVSGEASIAQLEKNVAGNKNKCKICDADHENLGKLWNHYKRTHKVMKDTIKSLISKSKCTICAANVTFIGDHYRTFHRFDKESGHQGGAESIKALEKESETKPGEKAPVGNKVEVSNHLSDDELMAKLPSGSLNQFPMFFDIMKKYYPGKSEKDIKLKTVQMFKKAKLEKHGKDALITKDNLNDVDLKTFDLSKVKEEVSTSPDLVAKENVIKVKSSLSEAKQIKIESEENITETSSDTKSYTCVICKMKVPHIWNHCRDSHNMSKEEFKTAMQSFHHKKKEVSVVVNNITAMGVYSGLPEEILPESGLQNTELSEELFIIDGHVGNGLLCNYCDFTCNKRKNLDIHTQLKHADNLKNEKVVATVEEVKQECEPCNLVLRKDEMELHKKIVHSSFTCEDCQMIFTSRKEFRNHTIMHMMESEVQMVDVVSDSTSDSVLNKAPAPMNLKNEPNEEYLYCDDCDFSSSLEKEYRTHVEINHVNDQPSANPCPESTKKDEKTRCSVCSRHVTHLDEHIKKIHPELEIIKDTPLYQEIMADKSLAFNSPSLTMSNVHGPKKTSEYINTLKEKISKDIEPEEISATAAEKPSKETGTDRVITINNTAMLLEECSICHQKVLYLSQHIQDAHSIPTLNQQMTESSLNIGKEIKNIKKETNLHGNASENGEYVANLISKLKDFDSDEEDDAIPSFDEQDVADTTDLIDDDPSKVTTNESVEPVNKESTEGLKLIDI